MRGICIPMAQVQHPREYLTSGAIQVRCSKGKRDGKPCKNNGLHCYLGRHTRLPLRAVQGALLFPRHSQAIADWHHHEINAFVGHYLLIEGAQGNRVFILDRRLGHITAPQDVINQHDAAGAQQFQAAFVIGVVG